MLHFFRLKSLSRALVLTALLALLATACSGGERPILTGERLVESTVAPATAVPTAPIATPVPAGATSGDTTDPATTAPPAPAGDSEAVGDDGATAEVQQLAVEVIESFPHDETAFTQGLELHDGVFIESTGLYGESELRRVVPATGEILQRVTVSPEFFAEGVTKVDDQLIQITWRENTAFFYDAATFEVTKEVAYSGEGWGICYDGNRLVMTDGTPVLIFRDATTFDETGRVPVTLNGQEVFNLNEIECVNGQIWANIWQTQLIVRIDPATGVVTGVVDAVNLPAPEGVNGAVLNGIAWDAATQSFYVTGKLWPTMYRVNFVPAPTG